MKIIDEINIERKVDRRRDENLRKNKKRLGDAAGMTLIQRAIFENEKR